MKVTSRKMFLHQVQPKSAADKTVSLRQTHSADGNTQLPEEGLPVGKAPSLKFTSKSSENEGVFDMGQVKYK